MKSDPSKSRARLRWIVLGFPGAALLVLLLLQLFWAEPERADGNRDSVPTGEESRRLARLEAPGSPEVEEPSVPDGATYTLSVRIDAQAPVDWEPAIQGEIAIVGEGGRVEARQPISVVHDAGAGVRAFWEHRNPVVFEEIPSGQKRVVVLIRPHPLSVISLTLDRDRELRFPVPTDPILEFRGTIRNTVGEPLENVRLAIFGQGTDSLPDVPEKEPFVRSEYGLYAELPRKDGEGFELVGFSGEDLAYSDGSMEYVFRTDARGEFWGRLPQRLWTGQWGLARYRDDEFWVPIRVGSGNDISLPIDARGEAEKEDPADAILQHEVRYLASLMGGISRNDASDQAALDDWFFGILGDERFEPIRTELEQHRLKIWELLGRLSAEHGSTRSWIIKGNLSAELALTIQTIRQFESDHPRR